MSKPKEYKISKVQDFFEVPIEKLDACLEEFREYINMAHDLKSRFAAVAENIGAKDAQADIGLFHWIDDARKDVTIELKTK